MVSVRLPIYIGRGNLLDLPGAGSMITYQITLPNGVQVSLTPARPIVRWKSRLMQECPYGTDFRGCTFEILRGA